MSLGVLFLHIHIPGCSSLKEKRRRLKPLIFRLHKEFNISAAEVDYQDIWQDAVIACALISNKKIQTQRKLQKIVGWVETKWLDVDLVDEQMEFY
jgi:uncharacterized protein